MHPLPESPAAEGFVLTPALVNEIGPNLSTALSFAGDLLAAPAREILQRIHTGLWAEYFSVHPTRAMVVSDDEHGVLVLAMCIVAGFTHTPVDEYTYGHRLRRSAVWCLAELTGPHSKDELASWNRQEREYAQQLLRYC